MLEISVIICTHNPRPNYMKRVLEALQSQTLQQGRWELLLVDNASAKALAGVWDLSWHSNARHIREDELGLTRARLRGIKESVGELLVFVDDDNVVNDDYLKECHQIALEYSLLGAWGGQQVGIFEIEPPIWSRPHLYMLAIREFTRDQWSNGIDNLDTVPSGAGLCVRKQVGLAWHAKLDSDHEQESLGRVGNNLGAAEDTDLALTACDQGLGTGIFVRLQVKHLIPKERLELSYLEQLTEGMSRSHVLLRSRRFALSPPPQLNPLRRLLKKYKLWRMDAPSRRLELARERGSRAGYQSLGLK